MPFIRADWIGFLIKTARRPARSDLANGSGASVGPQCGNLAVIFGTES